jgi:hypothetical protein
MQRRRRLEWKAVENIGPFFDKRSGPIVAIAAGSLSQGDAQTAFGRGELRGQRHLEREHVFRQEEQHRQSAGQHYSAVHYCGCDLVWRRESRSAALVFSCVAISPVPSSDEPTKPSSSRWTLAEPPAPELRRAFVPYRKLK